MSTDAAVKVTVRVIPQWVAAMKHHHGEPTGHAPLGPQDVWHWGTDERVTVAVTRHPGGHASVEVFRRGARVFEARTDSELTDAQVSHLLRAAGLLPQEAETS